MSVVEMHVVKYLPSKLYGFAADEHGYEVFFHLGAFRHGDTAPRHACTEECGGGLICKVEPPPPPILGEAVLVEFDPMQHEQNRAPKATSVLRLRVPLRIEGVVETYDSNRGYGFVLGDDGVSYHLHMSEVINGRLPLATQRVGFYPGVRKDRPRACHVQVLS